MWHLIKWCCLTAKLFLHRLVYLNCVIPSPHSIRNSDNHFLSGEHHIQKIIFDIDKPSSAVPHHPAPHLNISTSFPCYYNGVTLEIQEPKIYCRTFGSYKLERSSIAWPTFDLKPGGRGCYALSNYGAETSCFHNYNYLGRYPGMDLENL